MSRRTILTLVLTSLLVTMSTSALHAADWGQWRGPTRDGHVADFEAPPAWPVTPRVVWKAEAGDGYASPVVQGDTVFVHAREGDDEVVRAHDLLTGDLRWMAKAPAPFKSNQYALSHGKGPFATPLAADGRLFTVSIHGVVTAYDTGKGTVLWRHDHSADVTTEGLFCGTSGSPLLDDDRVIVHLGDDKHGGALLAFDRATGDVVWRFEGDGPGYASPIVVEREGVRQIVTLSDRAALGIAAADGTLLWRFDFADEWNENIVTPIDHDGRLILSGVRRGTLALGISKTEKEWTIDTLWKRTDVDFYMSTPVVARGALIGLAKQEKGHFVALDPATGETLWATEGRQAEQASILTGDGLLMVLTEGGELLVAEASKTGFEPFVRSQITDGATWSHPAMLDDGFVVRDAGFVRRLQLRTTPAITAESTDGG